jgi:serine/threonine-protein kinase
MEETQPAAQPRNAAREQLAAALPAYEIGAVLGRGAFALVYAGRHRHLERQVAIKRLSPDLLADAGVRERFAAEARMLASLDHPHIVRVYDYVDQEQVCALVMEHMPGGSLADRLVLGRVARTWACAVTVAALHGLEHAHRQGVLHRDVKPDNLLFADGSLVKVGDFGIAKVLGAQGARLTATAAAIGTPAYMAPEQVTRTAGPLSAATDVWAAGAVLYEMLAGRTPFPITGEMGEVLFQRVTEDSPPLREIAPDVPEELAAVVMRALRRDPAERYATARAFAADLEAAVDLAAAGVPIHRTPPPSGGLEAPVLGQPAERPAAPRRGRRGRIAAGIVALAVVVTAAVLLLAGSGEEGAAALPPAPPGWPAVLSPGFIDQVDGPAGAARRLGSGGNTFRVFFGDAAAGTDWSKDSEQQPPSQFAREAERSGLFPYMAFYSLRALGRTGRGGDAEAPELRETLSNPRLMGIYWRNVRAFLRDLGTTRRPAAVSLDSNAWSSLEQHLANRGERPTTVRARVALSGLPELRGAPDNLLGIAEGWRALRDRYAPEVLLGYAFDDWAAAGVDISRDDPPLPTVRDSARQAAEFFLDVAANQLDFAALTVNGDGEQEGQNPSRQNVYSPSEKEKMVEYVREFVRVAGVPLTLEGVPLGNTASRAITDKPYHWRDSWVQWLLGDADFTGLRKMRDAGVIGAMFGNSFAEGETCPCDAAGDGVTNGGPRGERSTSADDDGGYFAARVADLRRAGGLSLER